MIISIGTDLVEIPRFAQVLRERGARFEKRIFTFKEIEYCRRRATFANSLAARFGAKEAVMKALGTGWRKGVRWVDIEVVRKPGEAPTIQLHGRCKKIAAKKGIRHWHLSLTHTEETASAMVVAEGKKGKK